MLSNLIFLGFLTVWLALGDQAAKQARMAQLREPHITQLTDFVEALRQEAGPGASIPNFDPWEAGVSAEVLFLLKAPGT